MLRFNSSVVLILAIYSGLASPINAQITGAILQGIIRDPNNAPIPNVEVAVRNPETGVFVSTQSNVAGFYQFPTLNAGNYDLTAKVPGFSSYSHRNIQLTVGQTLSVDFALQVASVKESIEVTDTPTVVDTESASASHLVSGETFKDAPLPGRNMYWVTRFVPGGNPTQGPDTYSVPSSTARTSNISFNGVPAQSNSVLVNGVVDQYGNGTTAYSPSTLSVQEVRVQTFALSAEYGQTAGGVVSIETKSGTNTPHGALWYYHNGETMSANSFFNNRFGRAKAENRSTQLGANFGGPIYIPGVYNGRNRTFFFFDFDGVRDRFGTAFVNTVPTQLERTGDFSQTRTADGRLIQVYNPFTTHFDPANSNVLIREPFPQNVIPSSMISPIALNVLKFIPQPNAAGSFNNNLFSNAFPQTDNAFNIRVDHQITQKDTLYWSYGHLALNVVYAGALPTGVTGYVNHREDQLGTFGYTHVFNPTMIFNLRAGIMTERQTISPRTASQVRDTLGFPTSFTSQLTGHDFPRFSNSDMVTVGQSGKQTGFYTPNVRGFITKISGTHSLNFGYEFRMTRTNFRNDGFDSGFPSGLFNFTRDWTQGPIASASSPTAGYGVATLLLGTPSSGQVDVNATSAAQSLYHALYVQDNWRLTSKLTLNVGLRYDYQTPVSERFNRMNHGFDFQSPSPIAPQVQSNYAANPIPEVKDLKVVGGIQFVGVGGQPRYDFEPVRTNFMPRIGIAYQFAPKTVIRAGYGLYYIPLVEIRGDVTCCGTNGLPMTQVGFSSTTAMQTSLGGLPFNKLGDPFPQGVVAPVGSSLGLATLLGQAISVYDPTGHRGHAHQFQVSIQRELPMSTLLDVAYVGSRVADLPVDENRNGLPPQYLALRDDTSRQVPNPFFGVIKVGALSQPTVAKSQLLLPYPQFTGFTYGFQPIGSTWYNSLQFSASKRFSGGFSFLASYTLSKNMQERGFLNPYQPLERVISGVDRPHRIVVSGQWDLPFGKGKKYGSSLPRLLQVPLGGWEFGWVVTLQSGQPVPGWSGAIVTRALQPVDRSVDRWFDTGAFAPQPAFTLRTISSNISRIRTDRTKNFDLTLAKNFRIREKVEFRPMVQFINAFNTPIFAAPNTTVTSPSFGAVTSQANNPRWIFAAGTLTF